MKIWITRDKLSGEEPELLMLHTSKPIMCNGSWISESCCFWTPQVETGECSEITLEPDTPIDLPPKTEITRNTEPKPGDSGRECGMIFARFNAPAEGDFSDVVMYYRRVKRMWYARLWEWLIKRRKR